MTIPKNTARLLALMKAHRLTCKRVGELLGRREKTVRDWRCQSGQVIPAQSLELLEFKLQKDAEVAHG